MSTTAFLSASSPSALRLADVLARVKVMVAAGADATDVAADQGCSAAEARVLIGWSVVA